jgi:hypothetical protein
MCLSVCSLYTPCLNFCFHFLLNPFYQSLKYATSLCIALWVITSHFIDSIIIISLIWSVTSQVKIYNNTNLNSLPLWWCWWYISYLLPATLCVHYVISHVSNIFFTTACFTSYNNILSPSQPQPGPVEEPIRSKTEAWRGGITATRTAALLLRPQVVDNYEKENCPLDRHADVTRRRVGQTTAFSIA